MQERRPESRFTKSYKYKHKHKQPKGARFKEVDISDGKVDVIQSQTFPTITTLPTKPLIAHYSRCDNDLCYRDDYSTTSWLRPIKVVAKKMDRRGGGQQLNPKSPLIIALLTLLCLSSLQSIVFAFCPFKCLCNDQLLSANCTQVSSISIVPMTLNPLLKQLTLNHLPMLELSNSLSVYRQLEYLNLNSNQLRQIKYQNFNFRPAPRVVHLMAPQTFSPPPASAPASLPSSSSTFNNHELNSNNEQLAKHLKLAIDKSLTGATGDDGSPMEAAEAGGEDEIGFHLRELGLADNRIEQLGSLSQDDEQQLSEGQEQDQEQQQPQQQSVDLTESRRLRSNELERLSPFLGLTRLESLSLAGNRLTRLHQHAFLGLVHLKQLDLSRNQLEFIHKHAFVGLIELALLKLNQNRLARHLHQLSMVLCRAPMNELRYLDLSDNHKSLDHSPLMRSSAVSGESMPANHPGATTAAASFAGLASSSAILSQDSLIVLPNQMFICAPKLVSLRLEALQLRYIQVNAFDNLQQLETLNLSRNYLEQVPSESLSYSNSNITSSLRQLDLSETQIEFVNAQSFSSLRNLQRLRMNSMPRLVSFDLASLNVRFQEESNGAAGSDREELERHQNFEQLAKTSGELKTALKSFLPEHLFARVASPQADAPTDEEQPQLGQQQQQQQLVNDQLIELQLRHNRRLQSLHSSLATRDQNPRGRIKFSKLKLLDLEGALELSELPLEQMIDLSQLYDNLRLDLSFVTKLNCSSCQMSWLLEAARQQRQQQYNALWGPQTAWPPPLMVPFDPFDERPNKALPPAGKLVLSSETTGCAWPTSMSLAQLVEFEASSLAPLFSHCGRQSPQAVLLAPPEGSSAAAASPPIGFASGQQQQHPAIDGELAANQQHSATTTARGNFEATDSQPGSTLAPLHAATLLMLLILCLGLLVRLALSLVARQRTGLEHCSFKWRSQGLAPIGANSFGSPSSSSTSQNNANSPADCSSSSILSAANFAPASKLKQLEVGGSAVGPEAGGGLEQRQQRALLFSNVGQIERVHRRPNLFSRFVGRLRANGWPSSPSSSLHLGALERRPLESQLLGLHQATCDRKSGSHVIEKVVYGGDKNLLAYSSSSRLARLQLRAQKGRDEPPFRPFQQQRPSGQVGAQAQAQSLLADCPPTCADFIRPNGWHQIGQIGGEQELEQERSGCPVIEARLVYDANNCNRQQMLARQLEAMGLETAEGQPQGQDAAQRLAAENSRGSSALPGQVMLQEQQQRQQQQEQLHQPLAATLSPSNGLLDAYSRTEGHIYVTLDRPIRPQRSRLDDTQASAAISQRPPEEQSQSAFSKLLQAADNCEHKSFEWLQQQRPSEPLKVVDKFKLEARKQEEAPEGGGGEKTGCWLLENKRQEQFPSQLAKLSALGEQKLRQTADWPRFSGATDESANGRQQSKTAHKNGSPNLGSDRKPRPPLAPPSCGRPPTLEPNGVELSLGQCGNVTGQPDGGLIAANGAEQPSGRRMGGSGAGEKRRQQARPKQQQLFMGLNGSSVVETDDGSEVCSPANSCGAGKYDANHDAAPTTTKRLQQQQQPKQKHRNDNDYVINGSKPQSQLQLQAQSSSMQLHRVAPESHRALLGSLGVASAAGSGAEENADSSAMISYASAAANQILIGQQQAFVAGGGSGQLHGRSQAAERTGSGVSGAETGATIWPANGGRVMEGVECDYAESQQKFCDISKAVAAVQTSRGAIISAANSLPLTSETSITTTTRTASKPNNSQQEIYSNQFYYCKPSVETLSRERATLANQRQQPTRRI